MTYGEAKVYAKQHYTIADGVAVIKLPPHEPRKRFADACTYYNQKLKRYWKKRGYKNGSKKSDIA